MYEEDAGDFGPSGETGGSPSIDYDAIAALADHPAVKDAPPPKDRFDQIADLVQHPVVQRVEAREFAKMQGQEWADGRSKQAGPVYAGGQEDQAPARFAEQAKAKYPSVPFEEIEPEFQQAYGQQKAAVEHSDFVTDEARKYGSEIAERRRQGEMARRQAGLKGPSIAAFEETAAPSVDRLAQEYEKKYGAKPAPEVQESFKKAVTSSTQADLIEKEVANQKSGKSDDRDFSRYVAHRVPFVGTLQAMKDYAETKGVSKRVEEGKMTDDDAKVIASFMVEAEKDEKVKNDPWVLRLLRGGWDIGSTLPALAIELSATGGATSAVKGAAQAGAKYAAKAGVGAAIKSGLGAAAAYAPKTAMAAEYVAGRAGHGLAAAATNPQMVGKEAFESMRPQFEMAQSPEGIKQVMAAAPGMGLEKALAKGFANQAIMLGTFGVGGDIGKGIGKLTASEAATAIMSKIPQQLRMPALRGALATIAAPAKIGGAQLPGVIDMRIAEAVGGLTGLHDNYGTLGKVASGDPEGMIQLASEAMAFGAMHGGTALLRGGHNEANVIADVTKQVLEARKMADEAIMRGDAEGGLADVDAAGKPVKPTNQLALPAPAEAPGSTQPLLENKPAPAVEPTVATPPGATQAAPEAKAKKGILPLPPEATPEVPNPVPTNDPANPVRLPTPKETPRTLRDLAKSLFGVEGKEDPTTMMGNMLVIDAGNQKLHLAPDDGKNSVYMDFKEIESRKNSNGEIVEVSKELQEGSKDFAVKLVKLVRNLAERGVRIEYVAKNLGRGGKAAMSEATNVTASGDIGKRDFATTREEVYRRQIEKNGYVQVDVKEGIEDGKPYKKFIYDPKGRERPVGQVEPEATTPPVKPAVQTGKTVGMAAPGLIKVLQEKIKAGAPAEDIAELRRQAEAKIATSASKDKLQPMLDKILEGYKPVEPPKAVEPPVVEETKPAGPALKNAQAKEEFLRDVIAVMRGQENPGFHPDAKEVEAEAARRLSENPEKRKAIRSAENDWQTAKAEAAAELSKPAQPPVINSNNPAQPPSYRSEVEALRAEIAKRLKSGRNMDSVRAMVGNLDPSLAKDAMRMAEEIRQGMMPAKPPEVPKQTGELESLVKEQKKDARSDFTVAGTEHGETEVPQALLDAIESNKDTTLPGNTLTPGEKAAVIGLASGKTLPQLLAEGVPDGSGGKYTSGEGIRRAAMRAMSKLGLPGETPDSYARKTAGKESVAGGADVERLGREESDQDVEAAASEEVDKLREPPKEGDADPVLEEKINRAINDRLNQQEKELTPLQKKMREKFGAKVGPAEAAAGKAGEATSEAPQTVKPRTVDDTLKDFIKDEEATQTMAGAINAPGLQVAVPAAAAAGLAKSKLEHAREYWRSMSDGVRKIAGEMYPALGRMNSDVADAVVRHISGPIYAKLRASQLIDHVAGEKATEHDLNLYGTVFQELRHRAAKIKIGIEYRKTVQEMIAARAAGDGKKAMELADRAFELRDRAAGVTTFVASPDSLLTDEKVFQDAFKSQKFQDILSRWGEVKDEMESNFRKSKGLADNDPIETLTQMDQYPINAKVLADGEEPGRGVRTSAAGKLTNVRNYKLGFTNEAGLDAPRYDTNLANMIEHSISRGDQAATKAEMVRKAVEMGVAKWGPGRGEEGYEIFPEVKPPKGQQENDKGDNSLLVKKELADEWRNALNLDPIKYANTKAALGLITKATFMSTAEAVYHAKNLMTFMAQPGVNPVAMAKNFWGVVRDTKEIKGRLVELAREGMLKGEGFDTPGFFKDSNLNPVKWMGKFLNVVDKTMRLTADDAFKSLAGRKMFGQVENTPENRRNFVNQLGQYNRKAQAELVRVLRDTGVGPFATAGTNYWMQGMRTLTLNPGAKATSYKQALALRAEKLGRVALAAFIIPSMANYFAWGNVFGDDETPMFAIKTGEGKYFSPADIFSGLSRGMRQVGALAIAEGTRRGDSGKSITDKAFKNIRQGFLHPMLGPPAQFVETSGSGENSIGMKVARKTDGSEMLENLNAAAWNVNPAAASFSDYNRPEKPGDEPTAWGRIKKNAFEPKKYLDLLGPFNPKKEASPTPVELRHFNEKWHDLSQQHREFTAARRSGKVVTPTHLAEYKRMENFADRLRDLATELRGEKPGDKGVIPGEKRQREIRVKQAEIARDAMKK